MFHLKRQTLKSEYFSQFVESLNSNLDLYLTYSFVDIYEFLVSFLVSMHYRLKYLKFFDLEERKVEVKFFWRKKSPKWLIFIGF